MEKIEVEFYLGDIETVSREMRVVPNFGDILWNNSRRYRVVSRFFDVNKGIGFNFEEKISINCEELQEVK